MRFQFGPCRLGVMSSFPKFLSRLVLAGLAWKRTNPGPPLHDVHLRNKGPSSWKSIKILGRDDVAPFSYPIEMGVWRVVMPGWAVMAEVRCAEPSVERSAADRRAA